MPAIPETRASLILRLSTATDAEAWREFVAIYEPFVYQFARRSGFQDADARELVQNVMLAVLKAVGRWQPDAPRARFRTWLFRIARNQLLDLLDKRRRQSVLAGSSLAIQDFADVSRIEEAAITEHRRELFAWAAGRVRKTVKPQTWRAFWLTSVENRPVEIAAAALGLSPGAIYIARSRVMARLKAEMRQLESDNAL